MKTLFILVAIAALIAIAKTPQDFSDWKVATHAPPASVELTAWSGHFEGPLASTVR
jgi:hypothetical protein